MRVVQISDTHISADPAATFDGVDTAASLRQVLAAIGRLDPPPDRILLTGDLVHDPEPAAYRRLLALLRPLPVPVHAIPGNHDDPALMRRELTPPVVHDRAIDADGWRVLLLDSWLAGEHAGRLPASELHWLEDELARHPEVPTLVALHHPPVAVGSPWLDAMGLRNGAELFAVTDRHAQVRAILWGHIHQAFEAERHGTRLLGCPSTCVQFRPFSRSYASDPSGAGYRILDLAANGAFATRIGRVAECDARLRDCGAG